MIEVGLNLLVVAGPEHVPLSIVAELVEPVVYVGDLLHLDGVLAGGARNAMSPEEREALPPISSDWAIDLELPLARWYVPVPTGWQGHPRLLMDVPGREGEHAIWGWCASAELLPWQGHGRHEVRKKPPIGHMERLTRDGSVQLGAGPLKAYDITLPTLIAARMEWHAIGARSEVERLLGYVPAIGKKRNTGNGTVRRWHVQEIPMESCRALASGGMVTRRMPAESGLAGARAWGSIRPPYHHRSRMCEALRPAAM